MAGPVLQEMALEYLKNEEKDRFQTEFTGEIDDKGNLVPKPGLVYHFVPRTPSTELDTLGTFKPMLKVLEMTKIELERRKNSTN